MKKIKTIFRDNRIVRFVWFLYVYICYRYIKRFVAVDGSLHFQRGQIVKILRYSQKHSHYFAQLLLKKNITEENCMKILFSLPLLNKDIVRKECDNIFSDEIVMSTCRKINTGGSTGEPLVFPMKHSVISFEAAHQYDLLTKMGWKYNQVMACICGYKPSTENIRKHMFFKDKKINFPYGKWMLSSYYISEETVEYYVNALNKIKPVIIRSYPSALAELCVLAKRKNLKFTFKLLGIYVTSEKFTNKEKAIIKEFCNCPIWEQYGHTESSIFAYRSEQNDSFHVSPYYGFTEVLDPKTLKQVKPGEQGEIYVTGFFNRGISFIRYATGDYAIFGKRLPDVTVLLKDLQGRSIDYVVNLEGEKIYLVGLVFGNHLHAFDHIENWQIQQNERGIVIIHIVTSQDYTKQDEDELSSLFKSKKINILFDYCKYIKKSKRGKHVFMIQNLK